MLNALTALILASNIVLHAPDDPACKNAPAGWIRGIARAVGKELGQEARAAPTAPKETVVALQAVVSHKFGFNPLGTLNAFPIRADGTFSFEIPKGKIELVGLEVNVQSFPPRFEGVVLTFAPELLPKGACIEVFLTSSVP